MPNTVQGFPLALVTPGFTDSRVICWTTKSNDGVIAGNMRLKMIGDTVLRCVSGTFKKMQLVQNYY